MKWISGFKGGAIGKVLLTLKWKRWFLMEIKVNLVIKKNLAFVSTCHPLLKKIKVLQIVSDILGTIINVIAENMQEVRLVCKNVFLNILIMKGIMGSYMTLQLRWSIKLMQNILSNENTTSDISSKRWHFMVLMLKIISKLQCTCIFLLLVPRTKLLVIKIINLVIVIAIL